MLNEAFLFVVFEINVYLFYTPIAFEEKLTPSMNSEVANWISVVGSILSLLGVIIAIQQIRQVKKSADAAKEAADRTQRTISRNLLLSDVKNCIKNLEEIQLYVRFERYESAQLRTSDLVSYLYQIQQRTNNEEQQLEIEYEEMLSQLAIIREEFEKKVHKTNARIDNVRINIQLSEISDSLNKLVGGTIIAIEKGEQNG